MADEEFRIGRLQDDLDKLSTQKAELQIAINDLKIQFAVLESRVETVKAKTEKLENALAWVIRTVSAIFLAAIVGFIISGGLVIGGTQ